MGKDNNIINLEDVFFGYQENAAVLKNINLEFGRGERVGIVGANGSGKTTLFHVIMGLLYPNSGKVEIFGKPRTKEEDFREVRSRVGLLFQDADDQLFSPTVAEDVAFGPFNLGKSRSEVREIVENTLDMLGLSGFADRITYKLSGGEKKLVSLATVLAMQPEVLLLDEPAAGLDEDTVERIVAVLNESNFSYIAISHDREFLDRTVNGLYRMNSGSLKRIK